MSRPQSKTQKKIDNQIRLALTAVCESALEQVVGFQWLTHQVNYTNFPASLLVTCVFDTEEQLGSAILSGKGAQLKKMIQAQLLKIGVKFKSLEQQVIFDSEESCRSQNEGNWTDRLERRIGRAVARNRP